MSFSAAIADLDLAVFEDLADTATGVYIPAASTAAWSASKTSTAYLACSLIIDRLERPRAEGFDYQPPGHEVEIRVRASEVTPESGAQFYVAAGTWTGRWQIIECVEYDGTIYTLSVRSV